MLSSPNDESPANVEAAFTKWEGLHSIHHPPGDDPNGYELGIERWSPVHTVESIVLSIISKLSSPNNESPANVEAAKEWREQRGEFKKNVSRVRRSQEML
ncbi:unnamed protein product [Fraxinus pennsylvanica]|uniref:UBC core domain-containing protein n=1 Tax=Fraxinus pennsylvanica TaxID=56036 RepID=A0AAD1ZNH6_9LAMI|nr:unnamed protein product [Fraxinus pennsylvanica]